eukprot:scaffold20725_cov111-Isochrysis_galbana.AAC.17
MIAVGEAGPASVTARLRHCVHAAPARRAVCRPRSPPPRTVREAAKDEQLGAPAVEVVGDCGVAQPP